MEAKDTLKKKKKKKKKWSQPYLKLPVAFCEVVNYGTDLWVVLLCRQFYY